MANSSINLQPLLFESDVEGGGGRGRKENHGGVGSEENGWTENGEINFWLDFQSGLNSLRPPPRVSTALLRVIEYRSILSLLLSLLPLPSLSFVSEQVCTRGNCSLRVIGMGSLPGGEGKMKNFFFFKAIPVARRVVGRVE